MNPSEFEELRLRREVAGLRVEKEILRKAAAYFAQETIRSAASDSSPTAVRLWRQAALPGPRGLPVGVPRLPRQATVAPGSSRQRVERHDRRDLCERARHLRRAAGAALHSWLLALGFTADLLIPGERDGAIHHCQLDWPEGGRIMLSSTGERPTPCRPGTSSPHVATTDPDKVLARASAVDATLVLSSPTRPITPRASSRWPDPDGNHWTFATFVG